MTPTVPSPWRVLDLAATTDLAAIRRAYAQRLRGIDTTRDIDAFQQLRRAYESALALARFAAVDECEVEADDGVRAELEWAAGHVAATVATAIEPDRASVPPAAVFVRIDVLLARAVAELPALSVDEQRDWLDRELSATSLDQHAEFELGLLGRVLDDHSAWRDVLATLITYFHWDDPAQVDNRRDHGIQVLHQRMRVDAAYEAAIGLLERVEEADSLSSQMAVLREQFTKDANRIPLLDFAAVDLLVRGHPRFVRSAFALVEFFGWRRLAAPANFYEQLQCQLLAPNGEVWSDVIAAATDDLIASVHRIAYVSGQRQFLARDPRLEDLRWRDLFTNSLHRYWRNNPGSPVRPALSTYFGWFDVPEHESAHRAEALERPATGSRRPPSSPPLSLFEWLMIASFAAFFAICFAFDS